MNARYLRHDAAGWIKCATKQEPSVLGATVATILGLVGGGIYNCPIAHDRTRWDDPDYIEVVWSGELSNWDFDGLSTLWIECHRRMIRVAVKGATVRRLRLTFWQRKTRKGCMAERLPDCEELIASRDAAYVEPRTVAFQQQEKS